MLPDAKVLSKSDQDLIDGWQSGFPLVSRPYAAIGSGLGMSEGQVIDRLAALSRSGVLARIGATLRPNTVGASTLAAMRVPPERLDEVAAIVTAENGVNHNYEREHAINLWFVATGASPQGVEATLERIERASGLGVIRLPLEKSYFINLGFPMAPDDSWKARAKVAPDRAAPAPGISAAERNLLMHLEGGLELGPWPFAALGAASGLAETTVISSLRRLIDIGVIARFGLIVRHRSLGYRANAMAVWDVPDEAVDRVAAGLAEMPQVTLCYRRPRRLPEWRYNLFCMVHGRAREEVERYVERMVQQVGLDAFPHALLFSVRCFKQRGATLAAA